MAKDPYRYFRIEAQELLEKLGQGILDLERSGGDEALRRDLLRYAHTLKGAARVVDLGSVADRAHALEDDLVGLPAALDAAAISRLLAHVDAIHAEVRRHLAPSSEAEGSASAARPATVRVELSALDALVDRFFDVSVAAAKFGSITARMERLATDVRHAARRIEAAAPDVAQMLQESEDRARHLARDAASLLDVFEREVAEARSTADSIRLVAASELLPDLERGVRDASTTLGRPARFEHQGGEVRLDAYVLSRVRDALIHIVRNAVTHGIEDDRAAAGKPAEGRVVLRIERRGRRVSFICSDDGQGVSPEAVRRALLARGRPEDADAATLSDAELVARLATGGVSTLGKVTPVAGRGVGLEVAHRVAQELDGSLSLDSAPGVGTTVSLTVPVSLASVPVLAVADGGVAAVLPLEAVRTTRRIAAAEILEDAGGERLDHEGAAIPLVQLSWVLGYEARARDMQAMHNVVIIEEDGECIALSVDRIDGVEVTLLRALPAAARTSAVVSGASLLAEGPPRLVLSVPTMIEMASTRPAIVSRHETPTILPILVIDDSLTTRMLEQSILESAGYAVTLASSAEEGLATARARRPSLFIVDVEMPGMDGFQFLDAVQADPSLAEIPAVMVTSRGSAEDVRRGLEAGARAYIVKGKFDQGELLDTVRRLIG